jgi:hypothetical protein
MEPASYDQINTHRQLAVKTRQRIPRHELTTAEADALIEKFRQLPDLGPLGPRRKRPATSR